MLLLRALVAAVTTGFLVGCSNVPLKAGFVLEGKPTEGTEAPWHGRAMEGDVGALDCVEAIPFTLSRDPDWKSELRNESRTYETGNRLVPVERFVQRAVIYTHLGVRRLTALATLQQRGYYTLMPCGTVKTLLVGGEDVFLVSGDETRLLTLDGRVIWLARSQKPSLLTPDFRDQARSKFRHFTTFRRDEADGRAVLEALAAQFPLRAVVDGTRYSVTADFLQVATLTKGESGLDCLITNGALFVGTEPVTMVLSNAFSLPRNVKAAQGDCHRSERKE
ncbi:MAG: hypothetical protein WBO92_02760 [Candidatus Moraniibacteriota bacterium]